MDNIFISSGGFRNKLINEVADYVELIGCRNIEYSSGPYQDKIIDKFLNLEIENFMNIEPFDNMGAAFSRF